MSAPEKVLLAILATPPETSGERTLKRLDLAREILGFHRVAVVNVLNIPTFRTGGMATAGAAPEPWIESRPAISNALDECHGVVLGYGVSEPSGPARGHYRNQIDWLWGELRGRASPIWSVENPPRHPSRWHRLTYKSAPGLVFADVLATVLLPVGLAGESPAASIP